MNFDAGKLGSREAQRALCQIAKLSSRSVEHEHAEIDDQADFLGKLMNFRGRHAAELGMIPARSAPRSLRSRRVFQAVRSLVQDGDS